MPYCAKAVANEFLHLAQDERRPLTPMQLIKLVYFAYGWHWALAGERLLDERVEAWKYGPVVPTVYHDFKHFGNEPITEFATEMVPVRKEAGFTFRIHQPRIPESDQPTKQLIRRVWEVYKGYTGIELSRMTHMPGTPWSDTPNRDIKHTDIDDQKIRGYFIGLAKR